MANITPIKKETHQNIKIAAKRDLSHVENQHIAPITAPEYPLLSRIILKMGKVSPRAIPTEEIQEMAAKAPRKSVFLSVINSFKICME